MNLLILFLLGATQPTTPTGEDFVNKIFPNIWSFLVQFIAFIILVTVVWVLAYKPVHKLIKARKEYVENNLNEASSKNEEATKYLAESKAAISKSQKEATQIIQDAKVEAEKQKSLVIEQTNKEIAEKHAKAQEDIRLEQEKALKELHDDVVDLALEATKSVLNREVSDEDNKKLVDSFVNDLMEK